MLVQRDKIPVKVRTEGLMLPKGSKEKGDAASSKAKIDVYRGCELYISSLHYR